MKFGSTTIQETLSLLSATFERHVGSVINSEVRLGVKLKDTIFNRLDPDDWTSRTVGALELKGNFSEQFRDEVVPHLASALKSARAGTAQTFSDIGDEITAAQQAAQRAGFGGVVLEESIKAIYSAAFSSILINAETIAKGSVESVYSLHFLINSAKLCGERAGLSSTTVEASANAVMASAVPARLESAMRYALLGEMDSVTEVYTEITWARNYAKASGIDLGDFENSAKRVYAAAVQPLLRNADKYEHPDFTRRQFAHSNEAVEAAFNFAVYAGIEDGKNLIDFARRNSKARATVLPTFAELSAKGDLSTITSVLGGKLLADYQVGPQWQRFIESGEANLLLEYCCREASTIEIGGGREWTHEGHHHQSFIVEPKIVVAPNGFRLQKYGNPGYGFDQNKALEPEILDPDKLGKELRELITSGAIFDNCRKILETLHAEEQKFRESEVVRAGYTKIFEA